jgi:hypothetical protein
MIINECPTFLECALVQKMASDNLNSGHFGYTQIIILLVFLLSIRKLLTTDLYCHLAKNVNIA